MNGNLSKEYYVGHDGVFNDFAPLLNCFQAALYFSLKAKKGLDKPFELFVQDPSYGLDTDPDGRYREIRNVQGWKCFEVFQTHDVKGRGAATLAEIEALLDQGDLVIFETFLNRVPHMKDFLALDFPFDPTRHNTPHNHIFVAVDYSDTHLYYLESPALLNAAHVPYENSRCVGMIEKSVLHHAIDCFLNYRRLEIKDAGLAEDNKRRRVVAAMRSLIGNIGRPVLETPTYTRHYGTDGLDRLIACCRSGEFVFSRPSSIHQSSEGDVLEWKLSNTRQQKSVLYHCIEAHPELFGAYGPALLERMRASIELWQMTMSKLRLMKLRRQDDTAALQELLLRMKDSELRFQEEAVRWHARTEAGLPAG
ncbi:hypothetical protein B5M42_007240 [Paenibacillus athensensis]|uniref:Butirosin biosynthesis protein H N-terminal domain-containing protein n=1 Tax=Paenibacillus athensensis TaxID=1967502 RepID=A0A4Y8Q275_9BACL|nr:hypothetical protein [Paenibacillus athensensis]MCD1258626.1 hypothetical protein [Paenibacillus athensensis]